MQSLYSIARCRAEASAAAQSVLLIEAAGKIHFLNRAIVSHCDARISAS
jgi:hypothetical protein